MRTLQLLTTLTCGAVLGTLAPLPSPAEPPVPFVLARLTAGAPAAALRAGAASAERAPTAETPAAVAAYAWGDTLPAAPAVDLALPGPHPPRGPQPTARGGTIIRITESGGAPAAATPRSAACPRPGRPGYSGTVICIREANEE